jgi:hypothetical protein
LAGPDHLAAVAPLSAQHGHSQWRTGFRWALGHSTGVLALGALFLLFRGLVPLDVISGWSERCVGVVLIAIGFWGLRKAFRNRVHSHEHSHDGSTHQHFHVHGEVTSHNHSIAPHNHSHAAFAVGVLHGSAGGAHFLGVLPALAFPTLFQATMYVIAYSVGTIVAMSCFSWGLGWVARICSLKSGGAAYQTLTTACALFAVGTGVAWLIL